MREVRIKELLKSGGKTFFLKKKNRVKGEVRQTNWDKREYNLNYYIFKVIMLASIFKDNMGININEILSNYGIQVKIYFEI